MSTQFTEHDIKTLAQWNAVLAGGCCCEMPECATLQAEYQKAVVVLCGLKTADSSLTGAGADYQTVLCRQITIVSSGSTADSFNTAISSASYTWSKQGAVVLGGDCGENENFSGSGSADFRSYYDEEKENLLSKDTRSWTSTKNGGSVDHLLTQTSISYDTDGEETENTTITDTLQHAFSTVFGLLITGMSWDGLEATYTAQEQYGTVSDFVTTFVPYTFAEASTELGAVVLVADDYTEVAAQFARAKLEVESAEIAAAPDLFKSAQGDRIRYRWEVPAAHAGDWYRVTWDVLDEPDGWDADPATASRSFVLTNQQWTWEGAADRKSAWFEIDPPAVPGTRRIVNVRYECYRGPYGNRPQLLGEQVDLQ